MGYEISEEAKGFLDDVKRFCDQEVLVRCKEFDRTGEWPKELYEKALALGYHTLFVPEWYGGPGLSRIETAALLEQMAVADAGFAVTMAASGLALAPVLLAGDEDQKQRVCHLVLEGALGAFCLTEPQAGSDVRALRTTAVKKEDGYVLNGQKCFITNGSKADFYTVAAVTDDSLGGKGISMFLAEAGMPGLSIGSHEDKMGIRTSDTCEVIFEDCRLSEDSLIGTKGRGFFTAMEALNQGRAYMGAAAVGIAQRAIIEAVKYGKERRQFGKPVLEHQAIKLKLADMAMKTETARQMVAYALRRIVGDEPCEAEAAMAKCYASDIAVEDALEAIQILGGYGYSREYPVEKLLRDAKVFQIFEGSNEVLRLFIAGKTVDAKYGR